MIPAVAIVILSSCAGSKSTAPPEPVDPQAMMAAAREAVAADSTSAEAWFRLGAAWQESGAAAAADSARVAYERALELDPENVQALVHLGLALEDLRKPVEALEKYERATELAPEDPLPFINKGSLLYFHFKRTYDAKIALTHAIELDPKNPDAHFNLGVLFADANLYQEAEREWNLVIELAPDSPAANLARPNLEKIRPFLDAQKAHAASSTEETGEDPAGS